MQSPDLRLRTDVWRRLCASQGALTLIEKSQLTGIDIGTISRIERGQRAISGRFVAAVVASLNVSFDAVFEIVHPEKAA